MMTRSRRSTYNHKWYDRECKTNMRMRRKEYNRKVRHAKITEDSCDRGYVKNLCKLSWDTLT